MAQHADPPELLPRAPSRRQGGASEEPVEVRRYIDAIRRARWLIASIVVLLTGVVVGVSVSLPSRYEATASIVRQVNTSGFESVDVSVVQRELATIGQLMLTFNVLDAAARKLPGESYDSLYKNVKSSVDPEANLVFVTATAGNAQAAAKIANEVAQTFVDEQAAVEKRQLEAARANLLEEQNRLRGTTGADSQLQAIQQRLSELGVALAAAGTELGNGVLAAFLGLFIGVLVALGRDQLVPRVSSQRELSRLMDLPLLASIPYVNRRF